MKFNEYLQLLRKKADLSVTEVADKISVQPTTYRTWERGLSLPSVNNFCALSQLENVFELSKGTISKRLFNDGKNVQFKRVYVIHPLRNNALSNEVDVTARKNIKEVSRICSSIAKENSNILILSPVHAFAFMDYKGDQSQVFKFCELLLEYADEAWVFGNWQASEGCQYEINLAQELKIPIKYLS